MSTELDRAKERIVHESPVHGPILLAELVAAKAKFREVLAEITRMKHDTELVNWDQKVRSLERALTLRNERIAELEAQWARAQSSVGMR